MSASAPEATENYSTRNRRFRPSLRGPAGTRLALCGVALLGALLLVVSTFLSLYDVSNGQEQLRSVSGYEHHSIAMLLLGLAAVPMALGALRGARPAMYALGLLGVIVLVVAVTVDLPAALDEGILAVTYEGASAAPGAGFFTETLGGVLLLVSGGLQILRGEPAEG